MKRCTVCGVEQANGEYYRDHRAADGREGTCRTCKKDARPVPVDCAPVGDWQADAACKNVDPHIFWADDEEPAKAICNSCPVEAECLNWALKYRQTEFVIGGTTAKERRRMLRAAAMNGAS